MSGCATRSGCATELPCAALAPSRLPLRSLPVQVSGVTARLMRAPRPQGLGRRLERTDEVEVAGKGDIEVHWLLDESA